MPTRTKRKKCDDVLVGEVARSLGISRTTAWTRCARGEIPCEWRGGRYLVSRRTLNRLVKEKQGAAGATSQDGPAAA